MYTTDAQSVRLLAPRIRVIPGRGPLLWRTERKANRMTIVKILGPEAAPEPDDSVRRKYATLGEGARQARADMTRILRTLALVRVDAATCGVLNLDDAGRAIYVGRLRRVEEALVELERALAFAARYFDGAAAKFEAEGR